MPSDTMKMTPLIFCGDFSFFLLEQPASMAAAPLSFRRSRRLKEGFDIAMMVARNRLGARLGVGK